MRYTTCFPLILISYLAIIPSSHASDSKCKCEKCFEESRNYIFKAEEEENDESQKQYYLKAITSFVSASEYYLNNCMDSHKLPSGQTDALHQLLKYISNNCPYNQSTIQFLDIDNNATKEIIIHSVLLCNERGIHNAGFSSLFHIDSRTKKWKGSNLWPVELLKYKQLSKLKYSGVEYLTAPQFYPKIFMLDFKDLKGRTFMAVESLFEGGNYADHNLSIIRWDGLLPEEVLKMSMRDWCEQPYWTLEKDGYVIIPAAKATGRCKERQKVVFSLEKDCNKVKCDISYH